MHGTGPQARLIVLTHEASVTYSTPTLLRKAVDSCSFEGVDKQKNQTISFLGVEIGQGR